MNASIEIDLVNIVIFAKVFGLFLKPKNQVDADISATDTFFVLEEKIDFKYARSLKHSFGLLCFSCVLLHFFYMKII